jgi:hypothetical protein
MNIYKISQDYREKRYDFYKSAVVCAEHAEIARNMDPGGDGEPMDWSDTDRHYSWCERPDMVKVELIGIAVPGLQQSVICADFIAA